MTDPAQATRIKRYFITSILPTPEDNRGYINLEVVGHDKPISFSYHVPANLSDLLLQAIAAGFVSRFNLVASGLKVVPELVEKLEAEVATLTSGKFTTKTSPTKIHFADIIYAYGLSEFADVTDVAVASAYLAKWDALTKEEKAALRASPKVKRQLNNIENARIDAEEAAQAKLAAEATV